jgi:ATP-binding cassette, subfamily B, bacterial HlyB/CyaB
MSETDRDPTAERSVSSPFKALVLAGRKLGLSLSLEQIQRDFSDSGRVPDLPVLAEIAKEHGMKSRALKVTWRVLSQLDQSISAIICLRDGTLLVFDQYLNDPVTPQVVLRDPADPVHGKVAVDQLRLEQVWDGSVVLFKKAPVLHHFDEEDPEEFNFAWMTRQVFKERRLFRDILIAAMSLGVLSLVPSILYLVVIDKVLVHHRISTLMMMVIAIAVVLVFDMALSYLKRMMSAVATARIDVRLNLYIFNRLSRLPIEFFEQNPTGEIVHRLGEAKRVRAFITGQLFGTMLDLLSLVVLIPAMFLLSPVLSFWVLGIASMMSLVLVIYMGPIRKAYARVMKSEHQRTSMLIETINGIRTIKSMALEGRKRREWDQKVAESVRAQTELLNLANQPQTLLAPLEKLIYAGSLCIGAYIAISSDSAVMTGTLVAFTMVAQRATQPIVQLAALMQPLEEARAALRQVGSVINHPAERGSGSGVRPVLKGEIEFEDVRFTYAGGSQPALDQISFRVKPGEVVGIMGRSGSGKTTVTRLLQGLHQNYGGLIRMDGVELKEIDLYHLRSNIGVVLQESFMFKGSIRDNITAGKPDALPEEMIAAAQLAGADEFIERLPRGYDTMLEEGATNLSGGQRQRLAIARALISDPPVLVFDEATSALDPDSEAIIMGNLTEIARGRTVLMISHRLSSLVNCDQILMFERGRLRDSGLHGDLMKRSPDYRYLWNQQNRHMMMDAKSNVQGLNAVA